MTKGRILCTEDDLDSLEMMVLLLQTDGYEVVGESDPARALHLATTEPFDLLLLDNWMPGISGSELTRQIRKINLNTPILFYSGAAFDSDRQDALDAGAQGYLTKPSGIGQLIAEVDRLIADSRPTS